MAKTVVGFVAILWGVYLLDLIVPVELNGFGLIPRTARGLVGIVSTPFLHGSAGHLLANTVPLLVLLMLLAGTRPRPWSVVAAIVVGSGALLWLVGRPGNHIGASGLVFGLAVFLVLIGLLEKKPLPLLASLLVAFLYGGTVLTGVIPLVAPDGVSWDGHLAGAVTGAAAAFYLAKRNRK